MQIKLYGSIELSHSKALDDDIMLRIDHALEILKNKWTLWFQFKIWYPPQWWFLYPSLMKCFLRHLYWVLLQIKLLFVASTTLRTIMLRCMILKWNLTQLIAHETTIAWYFIKDRILEIKPRSPSSNLEREGYPGIYYTEETVIRVDLVKTLNDTKMLYRDPGAWGYSIFFCRQHPISKSIFQIQAL